MSYRTHKKRPTSIGNDLIMNHYVTPDGQILQSSLVKSGSPRKLNKSTSQVRFSLPPPSDSSDTEFSFEDSSEHNSFDDKQIFNLSTKELVNSTPKQSFRNSIINLISTSSDPQRLFVRPHSEMNQGQIPIPVELMLPPQLSPKNKGKRRPKSLVFNGKDYEPLQLQQQELPSPERETRRRSGEQISSLDLNQIDISLENRMLPTAIRSIGDEDEDLNERTIQNPSPAAKLQNNQLNKDFSFPRALPDTPSNALPETPRKNSVRTSLKGLQIYNDEDNELKSLSQRDSFQAKAIVFQSYSDDALVPTPTEKRHSVNKPLPQIQQEVTVSDDENSIVSSVEDETTQLFDLGNLIISSSNGFNLSTAEIQGFDKQLEVQHPESNIDNAVKSLETEIDKEIASIRSLDINDREQSYFQPPKVYFTDADQFRSINKRKSNTSPSSFSDSEFSEPFSSASEHTNATSISSPITYIDLTQDEIVAPLKPKNIADNDDDFMIIYEKKPNGQVVETIVIDDEEENHLKPTKLRDSNNIVERDISAFSFETIASEVQLNHDDIPSVTNNNKSYNKRASVIELCDETIKNTQAVMEDLKRQKTYLVNQRIELLNQKREQEKKLRNIKNLQLNLDNKKKSNNNNGCINNTKIVQPIKKKEIHQMAPTNEQHHDYFDYQNGQNYNFQSFMGAN